MNSCNLALANTLFSGQASRRNSTPPPDAKQRALCVMCMRETSTILAILILTLFSGQSFACSCIGRNTVEEEIENVDAVVAGRVLEKQFVKLTDSSMLKMFPQDSTMRNSMIREITLARYDFLVHKIYKGIVTSDTVTIYTGIGHGDCGIRFEIGKTYIVYGNNNASYGKNSNFKFPKAPNTNWTDICRRTTSNIQDEIPKVEKVVET